MKVETTRFGPLDIPDEAVLRFPEGLIGFESCTQFTIVDRQPEKSVWWLQSLDRPDIAFILTDPHSVVPHYQPDISKNDLDGLELESLADAEWHIMLVVSGEPKSITANLLGPLIVNPHQRLGKQVVLYASGYPAAYPLVQPVAGPTPTGDREGGGSRC